MRMPSGRIALVAITHRGAQQAGALARRLVAANPLLPTPTLPAEVCRGTDSDGFLTPSPLAGEGWGEGAEGLPNAYPRTKTGPTVARSTSTAEATDLPPPSPPAGEGWGEGVEGLPPASPRVTAGPTAVSPYSQVSAASPSAIATQVDLIVPAKFATVAAGSAWPGTTPSALTAAENHWSPRGLGSYAPPADEAATNAPTSSPHLIPYPGALKDQIGPLFATYDQIVFFVSLGAVIRLIAPHLQSKHQDPGVLVVDEAGRFVIPALSGHVGGANAFAEHVAALLGATPVLTTASDVGQSLAVDLLGRELGWHLEAPKINVTRVSAHVVNGEPIALIQEAGRRDWWRRATPPPANIQVFARFEEIDPEAFRGLLWVTRRAIPPDLWQRFAERLVVYRPPEDQP